MPAAVKPHPLRNLTRPGPASYGLGGSEPTVTDANLVLGRLRAEHFLGGAMKVKRDLAENAVAPRRLNVPPSPSAALWTCQYPLPCRHSGVVMLSWGGP